MERYQNGSLIKLKRKNGTQIWAFRWYEDTGQGRGTYRKKTIGPVADMPLRKDAEKAVAALRQSINSNIASPQTVDDLIANYRDNELIPERKAFASIENHNTLTSLYIAPKWGSLRLTNIRTVAVEKWLDGLPLAPASRTKIKATFSVLFSHAIRHEWVTLNPIAKVRTSSKRLREKDVLDPGEFKALIEELSVRERAMAILAGSTGLRRSEMFALTWGDLDPTAMEVSITRSCFRNRMGPCKTDASRRPVPLHPIVLDCLLLWRAQSPYAADTDFIFASLRMNGLQPLTPDTLLKRHIRPALLRAGITNKIIGWHNFRHSLATNLRAMDVDVKVSQELLRHANSRTTLDFYTHAVSAQKRAASAKVVELFRPERKVG